MKNKEIAKTMAYVILTNEDPFESFEGRNNFIKKYTGKEITPDITSDETIKEYYEAAMQKVLEKGEYKYAGDILGYCFSDPVFMQKQWKDDPEMSKAVKKILEFGKDKFNQDVIDNLEKFLNKEED